MKVQNLRPYAVEIVDAKGDSFECDAHPATVEVPGPLGVSLLEQVDAWGPVDATKSKRGGAADIEEQG